MSSNDGRAQFLEDIKDHAIRVRHDDGLYRHLTFSSPKGGLVDSFEIITFPHRLVVCGDRDAFVFCGQGSADLFPMFRDRDPEEDKFPYIRPDYWMGKLDGGRDRAKEFSKDKALEALAEGFEAFLQEKGDVISWKEAERLRGDVFDIDWDDDFVSQVLRLDEKVTLINGSVVRFSLPDFWEADVNEFTHEYLWSIRAVVWGIRQYDLLKCTQDDGDDL